MPTEGELEGLVLRNLLFMVLMEASGMVQRQSLMAVGGALTPLEIRNF